MHLLCAPRSLNHSCAAGDMAVLRYDRASRCAVLHAHRAYAQGDQVFDSYGVGRAPVDTLLDYGFAELPADNDDEDDWCHQAVGDSGVN